MDALMPFAHGSSFTGSVTQNNLSVYVPTIITDQQARRRKQANKYSFGEKINVQSNSNRGRSMRRRRNLGLRRIWHCRRRQRQRKRGPGEDRKERLLPEAGERPAKPNNSVEQPLLPKDERIVSANPSADASIIRPSEDVAKKPGSSGGGDFSTLIQCRNIHRINKIYHMKLLIRFEKRGYESDHNLEEDGYSEGNLISPPKRKSYQLQYVESSSHS